MQFQSPVVPFTKPPLTPYTGSGKGSATELTGPTPRCPMKHSTRGEGRKGHWSEPKTLSRDKVLAQGACMTGQPFTGRVGAFCSRRFQHVRAVSAPPPRPFVPCGGRRTDSQRREETGRDVPHEPISE